MLNIDTQKIFPPLYEQTTACLSKGYSLLLPLLQNILNTAKMPLDFYLLSKRLKVIEKNSSETVLKSDQKAVVELLDKIDNSKAKNYIHNAHKWTALALKMRYGIAQQSAPLEEDIRFLEQSALKYLPKKDAFHRDHTPDIALYRETLEEIARYKDLVLLLKSDPQFAKNFCKWSFRDRLPWQTFAYQPNVVKNVEKSILHRKFSQFPGLLEWQVTENATERSYALLAQSGNTHEKINLSSSKAQNIFQSFINKNAGKGGDFEVLDGKIYNFPGNLDKTLCQEERFWEKLPVYRHLTAEEVQSLDLKEGEALFRIVATGSVEVPSLTGNHALMELVLDINGKKALLPIGIFPRSFPSNFFEALPFMLHGDKLEVRYPDPAQIVPGYTPYVKPYKVPQAAVEDVLKEIRSFVLESKDPRFHIRWNNCAHFVERIALKALDKHIPPEDKEEIRKLFRTPMEKISGGKVHDFLRNLFEKVLWPIFYRKEWMANRESVACPVMAKIHSQET